MCAKFEGWKQTSQPRIWRRSLRRGGFWLAALSRRGRLHMTSAVPGSPSTIRLLQETIPSADAGNHRGGPLPTLVDRELEILAADWICRIQARGQPGDPDCRADRTNLFPEGPGYASEPGAGAVSIDESAFSGRTVDEFSLL